MAEEAALAAGVEVLRTAGSEVGTRVSFSALAALLRPLSGCLPSLSPLHRRALAAIEGDAIEPGQDRLVVFQAALALLGQAAGRRPLLMIVDDLQWLDRPSASALGFVARRLAALRVGFLAVSRPGTESFSEHAGLAEHELRPLDPASAERLLGTRFPELSPQVRQRLLAEAQGNPLALLELPAMLSGPQRAALAPLPSVLPLGQRLQAVFASQVGELPEGARQLLLLAALDGSGDLHVLRAAGPDEPVAALLEEVAAQVLRHGDALGALSALLRAAELSPARPDRSRRLAHAALVGASVTMEVGTVPPLLGDAGQGEPEAGTSLLVAATAAFMLLNGDGDVITAHRLLTQAIEDQPETGGPGSSGLFEAISTLFILCVFAGQAGLWDSFHAAVSRFAAELPGELRLLDRAYADPVRTAAAVLPGLERLSPRLSLIAAGAAALAAPRDQARGLFETALATPRADQWPFDVARIRLVYGEWLRRERSITEARAQLSTAMNTFRQLGALPWQARAGNELRAAGLATLATHPGSPLSPLDRQIAELAAAGLTNKQIGERLYLSHRTVAAHLYQIFPRLGITSRAALRDALDGTIQEDGCRLSRRTSRSASRRGSAPGGFRRTSSPSRSARPS